MSQHIEHSQPLTKLQVMSNSSAYKNTAKIHKFDVYPNYMYEQASTLCRAQQTF